MWMMQKNFYGDRTEFIGRNGLQNPDAMKRLRLSGKVVLALDPCAAIQVAFYMADGEEKEIIFRLGAGKDRMKQCHSKTIQWSSCSK